jgi:hypothetical protein
MRDSYSVKEKDFGEYKKGDWSIGLMDDGIFQHPVNPFIHYSCKPGPKTFS